MTRRAHDFYATNQAAVLALRHHIHIYGNVIEPCAGDGAIARCFRDCRVFTNDIDPRHLTDTHKDARRLFLLRTAWVVTNPPYGAAFQIVRHFVDRGHPAAFLLRMSWLEPTDERGPWLEAHPPERTIVLPRYSYTGDGKTDSVTGAWMCWNLGPVNRRGRPVEVVSKAALRALAVPQI